MPLRLRRGTDAERLTITPAAGELIYTTDYKKVFVGDGETIGGIDIVGGISGDLLANVNLNGYSIQGTGNIVVEGNISSSNILSNGTLTLTGNLVTSSTGYIAPGTGNTINTLELGSVSRPLQTIKNWSDSAEPVDVHVGLTNGFFSLISNKNSSRGTILSPEAVQAGDALTIHNVSGYDGYDYVTSSKIWHGVDPAETVSPGYVPGAIAFVTEGLQGEHVTAINSRGYLSINKYPLPATEALDVVGNGVFSGTVTAAAFKGSIVSDDSTTLVDGTNGNINGNVISASSVNTTSLTATNGGFTGNVSALGFKGSLFADDLSIVVNAATKNINVQNITAVDINATTFKGSIVANDDTTVFDPATKDLNVHGVIANSMLVNNGILFVNNKIVLQQTITGYSVRDSYGISSGFFSLSEHYYGLRGTLEARETLQPGDCIASTAYFGNDGTSDVLSSMIWIGVDYNNTVTTGNVPGTIKFYTAKPGGFYEASGFDSYGRFGVLTGGNEHLADFDVRGDAVISGNVTAAAFKGSFVADDSTIIIDGLTGKIPYSVLDGVPTKLSDFTNDLGLGGAETDPTFTGSAAAGITTQDITNWNDAYNWGNHANAGYLTTETEPAFNASTAAGITGTDTTNWTDAYNWGNHANAGYLTAIPGSIKSDVTGSVFADDSTVVVDGITGAVSGSTVTSTGFVMFGSYDATARAALTPANGMVIYNTTVDKFQGYQAGAWINLDDGSSAP